MDESISPPPRSVWADLDALVLEEMNALRQGPDLPPQPPPFASDADFSARVGAYLRGHDDPQGLIERLGADLDLFKRPADPPAPAPPENGEAPA